MPGFFHALELAVGSGPLHHYQHRGGAIVERLRQAPGEDIEWIDFYADAEAREVLLSVLVSLSRGFVDFERRKEWFIDIVNKELLSNGTGSCPGSLGWRFGEHHFAILFAALFRPLAEAMSQAEDRVLFCHRVGWPELERIKTFLERVMTSVTKATAKAA